METVYLETTFISLLVADPSRDLVTAANQQATRDWWLRRREQFTCVASREVLREAARGDREQVRRRLEVLSLLPLVETPGEAERLSGAFMATGALPSRAQSDAAHLAIATAVNADYLLTWNCRHLANAQILRRLEREAQKQGWRLPKVCTPPELMGDLNDEDEPDS